MISSSGKMTFFVNATYSCGCVMLYKFLLFFLKLRFYSAFNYGFFVIVHFYYFASSTNTNKYILRKVTPTL